LSVLSDDGLIGKYLRCAFDKHSNWINKQLSIKNRYSYGQNLQPYIAGTVLTKLFIVIGQRFLYYIITAVILSVFLVYMSIRAIKLSIFVVAANALSCVSHCNFMPRLHQRLYGLISTCRRTHKNQLNARQSANSRRPLDRLKYLFALCNLVTVTFTF